MLARFHSVTNASAAERIARAALLLPAEGNEMTVASELAQMALAEGTNSPPILHEPRAATNRNSKAPAPSPTGSGINMRGTFADRLRRVMDAAETNSGL